MRASWCFGNSRQWFLVLFVGPVLVSGCSTKSVPIQTVDSAENKSASIGTPNTAVKATGSTAQPVGSMTPIDLSSVVRLKAADFDRITTFPWPAVPRGEQMFAEIPIHISGSLTLWGAANAEVGMSFPERVSNLPIGTTMESLYICHAAYYEAESNTPIFHVVFHYPEGSETSSPVVCGADGRDWFIRAGEDYLGPSNSRSILAWAGEGHMGDRAQWIRFCLTALENPRPQEQVVSIDLVSEKTRTAGCIIGMTAGPRGLLKTDTAKAAAAKTAAAAKIGLQNPTLREIAPAIVETARSLPEGAIWGDYFDQVAGATTRVVNGERISPEENPAARNRIYPFYNPAQKEQLILQWIEDQQTLGFDQQPGVLALSWNALPEQLSYSGFAYAGRTRGVNLFLAPLKSAATVEQLQGFRVRFHYRATNPQADESRPLTVGVRLEPMINDSYKQRLDLGSIAANDDWQTFEADFSMAGNIAQFLQTLLVEKPSEFKLLFAQEGKITNYRPGDTLLVDDIEFFAPTEVPGESQ